MAKTIAIVDPTPARLATARKPEITAAARERLRGRLVQQHARAELETR